MLRFNLLPAITGIIVSLLTFGSLYHLIAGPVDVSRFYERIPGMDNLPAEGRKTISNVHIGEFFERFDNSFNSEMRGSWSGFRGNDSTNVDKENIPLLKTFSEDGPPVLWRIPLGEGHAGPAIYNGRFFVLDYLEDKKADALRCFSLTSGKELWRRYYKIDIKRNHGYSRTVPAVDSNHVVTIGPLGHVMCVNSSTGDLLWTIDMANQFKTTIPQWYAGQCPLLDGKTIVLAPAGDKTLLAGIDSDSGKIIWETPNSDNLKMSHSSVIPMVLSGHKMYVYSAVGGMVGIAADGETRGKILWQIGDWGATVVAPSPVILDDGMIFQSAGYGAGSVMVKLTAINDSITAQVIHRFNPKDALSTEQQSAIFYKGLLFGVLTKDAGSQRMMLVACNAHDPSQFVFSGNSELKFGLGPFLIADDRFFALTDDGILYLIKFEQNQFFLAGHSKILPGVDSWGPIAIADGLMLLRDSTSMACIDLTQDSRWTKGVLKNDNQSKGP
ncbi:MAG: PQQ-binding-like beta-propeller repeat protein [Candidatus Riflebacteria bacterium]|nr:PQQ-binding-like beta-propeller repeat protein [Candidatus Riflebacteria bacterium]